MRNESEKELSVAVSLMGRGAMSVFSYAHSFKIPEVAYLAVRQIRVLEQLDVVNSNMVY